MEFKLKSDYKPAGDQPKAIDQLIFGLGKKQRHQTLLGVTGSGKTFTIANVINKVQEPTLVIAHNKTLAAQLCNEFREFFPENAVEYFVSYYDYYQPEAYIPSSDTYIEKESQINEEIDRLRHACTQSLLSRKDVIVVASVSAIYNLGSPREYESVLLHFEQNQKIDRREMLEKLVAMQFNRTNSDLLRGTFRLTGQILEVMPVNEETIFRFEIAEKIVSIEKIDPVSRNVITTVHDVWLFPAKHYVLNPDVRDRAFEKIKGELDERLVEFNKEGKLLEAERLSRRTRYDLEMIKNVGFCSGIENYSLYFEERERGTPPFTLLDYFKECSPDFLTVVDESHVTLPQIRGMYFGDRSRKDTLVEHGFRLPSAKDNRPLTFDEFHERVNQMIFVSATPADLEYKISDQIVEQIVRPTGLIDPEVIIKPVTADQNSPSQIDDLMDRIHDRVEKNERCLVTTLTKKMAEDLTDYLKKKNIKVSYLHSDIDTLERIQIITDLRKGEIEVIVGVNLLREGLDMPEVSLVAILDGDKEGFLRNDTSLIQTIGRAARNANGQVLIYADRITDSIKRALEETNRRRIIQLQYNKDHGITPKTIEKAIKNILEEFGLTAGKNKERKQENKKTNNALKIELEVDKRPVAEIIKEKEKQMKEAAKALEFELAALLRDELRELKNKKASPAKRDPA